MNLHISVFAAFVFIGVALSQPASFGGRSQFGQTFGGQYVATGAQPSTFLQAYGAAASSSPYGLGALGQPKLSANFDPNSGQYGGPGGYGGALYGFSGLSTSGFGVDSAPFPGFNSYQTNAQRVKGWGAEFQKYYQSNFGSGTGFPGFPTMESFGKSAAAGAYPGAAGAYPAGAYAGATGPYPGAVGPYPGITSFGGAGAQQGFFGGAGPSQGSFGGAGAPQGSFRGGGAPQGFFGGAGVPQGSVGGAAIFGGSPTGAASYPTSSGQAAQPIKSSVYPGLGQPGASAAGSTGSAGAYPGLTQPAAGTTGYFQGAPSQAVQPSAGRVPGFNAQPSQSAVGSQYPYTSAVSQVGGAYQAVSPVQALSSYPAGPSSAAKLTQDPSEPVLANKEEPKEEKE